MSLYVKMGIVVGLMTVVGGVVILKHGGAPSCCPAGMPCELPAVVPEGQPNTPPLPRLVDLGADKCVPCKMMAPILEELKSDYQGKLDVVFIDVWKNPDEAKPYNINLIPTQIFYDASGKELFRHEGFYPKEDILAKWKELGYDIAAR